MAKKLSSVLGVDIGSQKIKVCEIRTQGREPVVTALGMIDTPEGAVDHAAIYNSEAVAAALKQLLTQCGATVGQAVVSIAGQASVLVRTVEVPRMNPAELKEHMQWEVNRNVPFAESSIVSDFRALPDDDPNSAQMDVVMAIAPQSAIDAVVDCVKRAGKQTVAIDVEPLSIARSLQMSYGDTLGGKTVCMVDVGHKTTSINIYRGDKLIMPRQVPLGGEAVTSALANALTLPISDAEAVKIEKFHIPESAGLSGGGLHDPFAIPGATQEFAAFNPFSDDVPAPFNPEPLADPLADTGEAEADAFGAPPVSTTPAHVDDSEAMHLFNAAAPVLEEFVGEIRRSIDYYRSRGGEVDNVELCGGGARLGGLAAFLTRSLGIPCDAYDPLKRLNLNMKKVAPGYAEEHRQEFAVAVGNGLHIFYE